VGSSVAWANIVDILMNWCEICIDLGFELRPDLV
jgi:hypothetical protein